MSNRADSLTERTSQNANVSRFRALDGVRAISAALVLLCHQVIALWDNETSGALRAAEAAKTITLGAGSLGVSVFFVLSGYLITSLLINERNRTGSINFPRFFGRRARRILPAYFFFLSAVFLLSALSVISISPLAGLFACLFIFNYFPIGEKSWWIAHTWSLSIEQQFYLLWPLAIRFESLAARFAVACVLLEPFLRIVVGLIVPASRPYLQLIIFTRADILMYGALVAFSATSPVLQGFYARTSSPIALWTLWLCATLAVPILEARIHGFGYLIGYPIIGLAASSLIYFLVNARSSTAAKILGWGPLARLGVLSYGIYLWQQLFFSPDNHTITGVFPFNLLMTLAVAWLSYEFVEKRFFTARPVSLDSSARADE